MSPFGHVRRHLSLMLSCFTAVVLMWANEICAATTNFNGPAASVIATIPIPSIPPGGNAGSDDVQVNTKTNRIYVTGQTTLAVLDGATDIFIANVPIPAANLTSGAGFTGLYQSCVDDRTNTIYAIAEVGVVTAIDGATNTIASTFAPWPTVTVAAVDGIVCNPVTGKLYMILYNNQGPKIVVWDIKARNILATLTVSRVPHEWMAVNRKTNRIYAQTLSDGVVVHRHGDRQNRRRPASSAARVSRHRKLRQWGLDAETSGRKRGNQSDLCGWNCRRQSDDDRRRNE